MVISPKPKNKVPKRNLNQAGNSDNKIVIDDRRVRLIGVPFFGLVIPSATGLISIERSSGLQLFAYYTYFILLAWIVWEGNKYLRDRFYHTFRQKESSLQKYTMMIAVNVFYTAPASLILLFGWKWVCNIEYARNGNLFAASAVIIVSVIFITNIYDKIHFTKDAELQNVKFEQLERAKIQAELEALKNQIDPHFMFNALNSLSFLIVDNPTKAQRYTENLAEVYRYILRSKDKDLVPLKDEIEFMNLYGTLLELRYEDAFRVDIKAEEPFTQGYLLPPVSLMVALENAVKHNEVSKNNKLVVDVVITRDHITIKNKLRERKTFRESTRTGLKNLDERFLKLMGKGVKVISGDGYFVLEIPLLKLNKA